MININSTPPKVFVIILNYNGRDTLKECLTSVFQMDYPNFEVVIIDNNSQDGSFELAKGSFLDAHFIKNEENLGFAAGNNIGIRFALEKMADYIFLLNNDAAVFENTISELIKVSQRQESKKIGIFSPLILKNNSKDIWFAGGRINWFRMRAEHTTYNPQPTTYNLQHKTWNLQRKLHVTKKMQDTEYVTGCAMLIKKEVFKKIGLLDENFFLYYEDADFCRRAKKEGFKSVVVTNASIKHYEKSEQNKKAKTYWLVVSGIYFFRKNPPWFLKPWITIYLAARKIKNKMDIASGKGGEMTKEIARAYEDSKNAKQN